jgi:hypothetical protein
MKYIINCMPMRSIPRGPINYFSLLIMMRILGTALNMKSMVLLQRPGPFLHFYGRVYLYYIVVRNYPIIKDYASLIKTQ